MTEAERELDLMVGELEVENKLTRERYERLERVLAITVAERDAFQTALERIVEISQLAFRDSALKAISEVAKEKRSTN